MFQRKGYLVQRPEVLLWWFFFNLIGSKNIKCRKKKLVPKCALRVVRNGAMGSAWSYWFWKGLLLYLKEIESHGEF